ncbi:hypothetical protein [Cryobacterium sp. TMT2-17-1]|uniref:hypothetical protein n=1 Tax=Cryobacterium sp. TMT2-17-1 TaxID=1259248 RepID=UPI00106C41D2|nr:hypothetical protein [Cryobacterium sp. TMT2-17-1]
METGDGLGRSGWTVDLSDDTTTKVCLDLGLDTVQFENISEGAPDCFQLRSTTRPCLDGLKDLINEMKVFVSRAFVMALY